MNKLTALVWVTIGLVVICGRQASAGKPSLPVKSIMIQQHLKQLKQIVGELDLMKDKMLKMIQQMQQQEESVAAVSASSPAAAKSDAPSAKPAAEVPAKPAAPAAPSPASSSSSSSSSSEEAKVEPDQLLS